MLLRWLEDTLTFGGSLTRLSSLRTKFWSSCQPHRHQWSPCSGHILGTWVCLSSSPWKRFLTPTLPACDLWLYLPLGSASSLPGARAENKMQLRETYKMWLLSGPSKESFPTCAVPLRGQPVTSSRKPGPQTHGAGQTWRTPPGCHLVSFQRTASALFLKILKKTQNNFAQCLSSSVRNRFSKKSLCFCFRVGGPAAVCPSGRGVPGCPGQICCFPALPAQAC